MTFDVAIIGAGPLGIELAVALKRAGVSTVHFDSKQIGYTISWFPPQTRFFSSTQRIAIAGVPLQTPDQSKATREQYLAYLRSVVEQFDLRIDTYEKVISIKHLDERFELHTSKEKTYHAKKIVLATGGTDTPRRMNIPGEDLPHVHPFWKDPHDYFAKRVAIIGGKNSAVETALRLHLAGAKVTLIYRQSELPAKSIKYWLLPEMNSLLKSRLIASHMNACVTRITPTHVELSTGHQLECDFVIPQIGYVADMSLAKLAGVQLSAENQVPTYNPETMETNIPGIYLCGTVIGGTQRSYEVFIENGHVHVDRIVNHLQGARQKVNDVVYANPES